MGTGLKLRIQNFRLWYVLEMRYFLGGTMNQIRGSIHLKSTNIYNHNQIVNGHPDENSKLSGFYAAKGKRLLDIFFVLLGAPFVLPLMLAIAALIKLDGGSAFYRQKRLGHGGKEFELLKFRSMIPNADQELEKHLKANPNFVDEWETKQKLEHDPRVTNFGRFIRMTSLDELPQIWNVLVGDMSLVGPRPILPKQLEKYPGKEYHLMRPGMTGSWQVSDRNKVGFADRAMFDREYAKNICFSLDLKILLQTLGAVYRCTGR